MYLYKNGIGEQLDECGFPSLYTIELKAVRRFLVHRCNPVTISDTKYYPQEILLAANENYQSFRLHLIAMESISMVQLSVA